MTSLSNNFPTQTSLDRNIFGRSIFIYKPIFKIFVAHFRTRGILNNDKTRASGRPVPFLNTDDTCYVDFAYLDTITYVEVIFHSQHFFSIYLCSSTLYRKQLTWSNECLGVIFHALNIFSIAFAIAYKVKNRHSQGRRIVCLGYVYALPEMRKSSKQWSKNKVTHLLSIEQLILNLAQLNPFTVLTRNHTQYP